MTQNMPRQPTAPMRLVRTGPAMSRLPETATPPMRASAKPRSARGSQRLTVRVAAGKAGASPAPRMIRISRRPTKPPASGTSAVAIEKIVMATSRTFRGPYLSTSGPDRNAKTM